MTVEAEPLWIAFPVRDWERDYSGFRSYEVHLSPLIACGEGLGVGFLYLITPGSAVRIYVKNINRLSLIIKYYDSQPSIRA